MSDISSISAKARELTGKGPARRLRDDGRIPAIVYGGVGEPVQLSLNLAEFHKEFRRPGFFTRLYDISVDDDTVRVLPRDVQLHPVTDYPLHADFLRYVKGAQIAVNVAVRYSPRWIDPEILSLEASPENRKGTEFPGLRISLRSLTWFPSTTPEISWTENSLSWIPSIQLPSCEIDHR